MKSIMISIQPKWCAKIESGAKTIEVRKTRPKIEPPFKCYIYESKGKTKYWSQPMPIPYREGGGKVIGEFVCDRIYNIEPHDDGFGVNQYTFVGADSEECKTGLSFEELKKYLGENIGFGWHISDLKIYDKPRELGEFKKVGFMTEEQWLYALYPNTHCHYAAWAKKFEITRPPQSWCYVEELEERNELSAIRI